MSEQRFRLIEGRLDKVEANMVTKTEFAGLKSRLDTTVDNTDEILRFIQGTKRVWGVTTRHWKTIIVFGAGIMTSAGIGNPEIWKYISQFLGGT